FRSTYLCDFSVKAQPKLAVKSVMEIGEGKWEEQLFWIDCANRFPTRFVVQGALSYVSQSSTDLLYRFFVTSSYSMAVPRLYPMLIGVRRCLLNPISLFTSVKGFLRGQMWSFCSSIRGAASKTRSPRNSCIGCA